jgi:hypothetical protein
VWLRGLLQWHDLPTEFRKYVYILISSKVVRGDRQTVKHKGDHISLTFLFKESKLNFVAVRSCEVGAILAPQGSWVHTGVILRDCTAQRSWILLFLYIPPRQPKITIFFSILTMTDLVHADGACVIATKFCLSTTTSIAAADNKVCLYWRRHCFRCPCAVYFCWKCHCRKYFCCRYTYFCRRCL